MTAHNFAVSKERQTPHDIHCQRSVEGRCWRLPWLLTTQPYDLQAKNPQMVLLYLKLGAVEALRLAAVVSVLVPPTSQSQPAPNHPRSYHREASRQQQTHGCKRHPIIHIKSMTGSMNYPLLCTLTFLLKHQSMWLEKINGKCEMSQVKGVTESIDLGSFSCRSLRPEAGPGVEEARRRPPRLDSSGFIRTTVAQGTFRRRCLPGSSDVMGEDVCSLILAVVKSRRPGTPDRSALEPARDPEPWGLQTRGHYPSTLFNKVL